MMLLSAYAKPGLHGPRTRRGQLLLAGLDLPGVRTERPMSREAPSPGQTLVIGHPIHTQQSS